MDGVCGGHAGGEGWVLERVSERVYETTCPHHEIKPSCIIFCRVIDCCFGFLNGLFYVLVSVVCRSLWPWLDLRYVMKFGRGDPILVCVLSFLGAVAASEASVAKCEEANFVMTSAYNRMTGHYLTDLRTDYTLNLVSLIEGELVTPYSWINVSEMEPEWRLALFQRAMVTELSSKFPGNKTISVEYRVAQVTGLITIRVDSSYAMFYMDSSSVEVTVGIDADVVKHYVGDKNFTTFGGSQSAVLSRWHRICEDTAKMDTGEDVNVTFVYYVNGSMFECSVIAQAPMAHSVSLSCVGHDGSPLADAGPNDVGVYEQTVLWTDHQCRVATAKCIVNSQSGWRIEVEVDIVGDSRAGAAHVSDIGTHVVVAFFFIVLVLGLLLTGWHWYKSSARTGMAASLSQGISVLRRCLMWK